MKIRLRNRGDYGAKVKTKKRSPLIHELMAQVPDHDTRKKLRARKVSPPFDSLAKASETPSAAHHKRKERCPHGVYPDNRCERCD
jgi:hypothetical protein